MTNQQCAIILEKFCKSIVIPAISSADTDVVSGITEAFTKAINLLKQTSDNPIKVGDTIE